MTKEAKPDAWMPLYIGDWDGDTGHLDCEQDGAYGRLIRFYWRTGPLPDDDAALSRIIRMPLSRWRKIRPVVAAFFIVADGVWRHKRADHEREQWAKRKAKAADRARQAAEKRWGSNAKSNATGMLVALLEECPSSSSTEVEGPKEPSTLCSRERPEARHEGASDARSNGVIDFDELRRRIQAEAEEMAGRREAL